MKIPDEISNGIVLTKNGLYRYSWYGGQKKKKINKLSKFLSLSFYIDEGITFGDVFELILAEHGAFSKIFYSHLGGFKLKDWVEDWENSVGKTDNDEDTKLQYLEVYWDVEFNKKYGLEESVGFGGRGLHRSENAYGDNEWHNMGICISLSPLGFYKDIPFKINNEWKFYDNDNLDKSIVNGKINYEFETTKEMTVYDVIDGILSEISFYGSPKDRDDVHEELENRMKSIEDGIAEVYTAEEVFDRVNNKINEKNKK